MSSVQWYEARPASLVLITGNETYLASRAVASIKSELRGAHPELEVIEIEDSVYTPGALFDFASPSLFMEPKLLLLGSGGEGLFDDLTRYLEEPVEGVSVVVRCTNLVGQSGKIRKELGKRATTVSCEELKRDADKVDFVRREFQAAGVKIAPDALKALVGAFTSDIGELGAACSQLLTSGQPVSLDTVETTFGGRVETNAFKIADAALAGNATEAIRLFRHGFATGIDSVALVAALSMRIRQLARLFNDRSASGASLGMQPWQIEKARKELAGWQENDLAQLVQLAATTDADVKGASRDPEYSIERLLLAMARAN
ncbi:MAG: DNA polymerase III subunit delta [Aquiluna sp.]